MDEEIQFILDCDIDNNKAMKGLSAFGSELDKLGASTKSKFADPLVEGMSKAGREAAALAASQLEMSRTWQKLSDFSQGIYEMDEKTLKSTTSRNDILKEITSELEKQREKFIAMDDPAVVKARVAAEREITRMQKENADSLAKEHREQERPGFFQKMFQQPGEMFKDIGGNVSKFAGSIKDEFKKGGVGGIADMLLGSLGKGGGATGGGGGALTKLGGALIGGAEAGGLGALGGSAAAAMGGPVGLAVAAGLEAVKGVGKVLGAVGQGVTKGLSAVNTGLKEMGGLLGPVGAGFEFLAGGAETFAGAIKSIPIVGDLLGPFADALAKVPSLLKDITMTLVQFAGVASPSQMRLFQYAVEDVQGVIGQTFLPVLELMRDGVRLFGDVLATILPNTRETEGALSGFRDVMAEVSGTIREAVGNVGPSLREGLIKVIKLVAEGAGNIARYVGGVIEFWSAVSEIGEVFSELIAPVRELLGAFMPEQMGVFRTLGSIFHEVAGGARWLAQQLRALLSAFGLVSAIAPGGRGMRTSVGAAAREGRFSGLDEYQRQLQLSAFREPGRIGAEDVPKMVGGISTTVERIRELLEMLTPAAIGAAVGDAFRLVLTNPSQLAKEAKDNVINNPGQAATFGIGGQWLLKKLGVL